MKTRIPLSILLCAALLLVLYTSACTRTMSVAPQVALASYDFNATPTHAPESHEATAAPHGEPTAAHAEPTAAHAEPTAAHAEPTAAHAEPTQAGHEAAGTPTTPAEATPAADAGASPAASAEAAPALTETPFNPAATPSSQFANSQYLGQHTVQAGETLDTIGRAYGVDPDAIMKTNNLTNYYVAAGVVLNIPPVKWEYMTYGPVALAQFPAMMPNTYFHK